MSSLEKETGTFLTVTCHQKKKVIVVPSYWFIKSAAVKCVVKVVLVVFSRSRARSRI